MENIKVPGMRLGRGPRLDDPRTIQLTDLLAPTVPSAPAMLDLTVGIKDWPMYANDRLGDCTCAALGHMLEVWSQEAAGSARILSDQDIVTLYDLVNGGQDNGASELTVLRVMRGGAGLAGDHVFAYAAVDPSNQPLVRAATWMFSGLYIGIAMPKSAQAQVGHVWTPVAGPDGQAGGWGGHAVNVVGYDASGLTVVTWGRMQRMDWAFWKAYVDEAWALLPVDFEVFKSRLAPAGFNFAQLQGLLQNVGPVDQLTAP
ncbi:MAG: hypothetical protein M3024_08140 [Candidatus Dormibacteraeota bacterium]|nr:hypothetical protein [Candidatus Dormibacteraeota bacterium]